MTAATPAMVSPRRIGRIVEAVITTSTADSAIPVSERVPTIVANAIPSRTLGRRPLHARRAEMAVKTNVL
jgi:hypothetical protein